MGRFAPYDWRAMRDDVFSLIGERWMLVTAGKLASWNTMTASWGGLGHLWNKDVAFAFVRPSRHSFGFMERAEGFTLSFFADAMRPALSVCGSTSGRDTDKAEAAGIAPRAFALPGGPERVSFDQARLVLSCRKLYAQDLGPECVVDPSVRAHYLEGDWHRLYVGGIEAAWIGEGE